MSKGKFFKGEFERPTAIAAVAARDTDTNEVGVLVTLDAHQFFVDATSGRWLIEQLQQALSTAATSFKKGGGR